MSHTPITEFSQWLAMASSCPDIREPTAMCLATASTDGTPTCRIVLLKGHDENGFVFYTNLTSPKSTQLAANPHAALCFYWMPLDRQVRIEGVIEPVSEQEADAYYASRPRASQIGAWSSKQSQPLASREVLERALDEQEAHYAGQPVPRPPHWSGWRLKPQRIEFWVQGDYRIHDRWEYRCAANGSWNHSLLYP